MDQRPQTAASRRAGIFAIIGPGILVAATGVGAGDLATAALTGSRLGVAVLWAVLAGAVLKLVLNEGLARWQLATGTTLLEGAARFLGPAVAIVFLPYLLFWSFFVGTALMSACGVASHALVPVFEDAARAKVVFGIAHGLGGLVLALAGGFKLFERVMSVCIGLMFVTVVVTAALLRPDLGAAARGLLVPSPATLSGPGLSWTVALMGGVGGTVTVLCYGYWLRECGRDKPEHIGICRIDLGVAYAMTAIFGIAMVIIGSRVSATGKGAQLVVDLARELEKPLGPAGRYAFLIGAWGAVASSLLGVWQAVPYLFADTWRLLGRRFAPQREWPAAVDTRSWPYRGYLIALATVPMLGLAIDFARAQKLYAIVGAAFLPILALALLFLNGSSRRIGAKWKSRWWTTLLFIATLIFFSWCAWMGVDG